MGRILRWSVVLLVLAALGLLIWRQTREKPVEVMVKTVERGTVEQTVANTRAGTVHACRRARLSPSIGGQIARLPIEEGDRVEAGQLLLELWNEDLKAQVEVAEKETLAARANAAAACGNAEEAERQAARAETLFNNQIGSREQTDRAITEATSLRAQCEAAEAAVARARAQILLTRAKLSRSRLVAPFDGIIAKIEGELNEYVTPSPIGIQTPPAVDLIENTCFYVQAPIDEIDGAAVRPGMVTRITLDAYRDRVFPGTVRRLAPFVLDLEKQARTVNVEIAFDNPEDLSLLLAGYSADVEIVIDARSNTLKVPTEAVMNSDTVYVYSGQNQSLEKVSFSPGLANWVFTEAVSGLEAGQRVVVNVDKPGLADGVEAVLAEEQR